MVEKYPSRQLSDGRGERLSALAPVGGEEQPLPLPLRALLVWGQVGGSGMSALGRTEPRLRGVCCEYKHIYPGLGKLLEKKTNKLKGKQKFGHSHHQGACPEQKNEFNKLGIDLF